MIDAVKYILVTLSFLIGCVSLIASTILIFIGWWIWIHMQAAVLGLGEHMYYYKIINDLEDGKWIKALPLTGHILLLMSQIVILVIWIIFLSQIGNPIRHGT